MGRLYLRIIVAVYVILAAISVVSGGIEIFFRGGIRNPNSIISSFVCLIFVYLFAQGVGWARIVLGVLSTIGFLGMLLLVAVVGEFNLVTVLLIILGLSIGWCAIVLFFSKALKAELQDRREEREAKDRSQLAAMEGEELRRKESAGN